MTGRRGDTRERIQQVALELFGEQGYERTTLQQVAERLQITRPALYYHFRTKDDILVSLLDDLNASVDEMVTWARAQPRTDAARREILHWISGLMLNNQWRLFVKFSQTNQALLPDHPAGVRIQTSIFSLIALVSDPDSDPVRRFETRLAVIALFMGSIPFLFDEDLPYEQRQAVALEVATKLASGDR